MQAMDLFDPRNLARASDPETSHQAAARVSEFAGAQRIRILAALRDGLKLGAEQIADSIGLAAYEVRKRLPELQAQGLAKPTDDTRTTRGGRLERVWVRT